MKHKQPPPEFKVRLLIPFPWKITVTQSAPTYIYIYLKSEHTCSCLYICIRNLYACVMRPLIITSERYVSFLFQKKWFFLYCFQVLRLFLARKIISFQMNVASFLYCKTFFAVGATSGDCHHTAKKMTGIHFEFKKKSFLTSSQLCLGIQTYIISTKNT